MSDASHRCESRTRLEFDHIEPVARGGLATVGNLRLRCRAHNQHAAEQAFGAGFVSRKRDERQHAASLRNRAARAEQERLRAVTAERAAEQRERMAARIAESAGVRAAAADVGLPWLSTLGISAPGSADSPPG